MSSLRLHQSDTAIKSYRVGRLERQIATVISKSKILLRFCSRPGLVISRAPKPFTRARPKSHANNPGAPPRGESGGE